MTDPVLRDLDRHLDGIDASEAVNARAERLMADLTPENAASLIDDYLADTGGPEIINALAALFVCAHDGKAQALTALEESIRSALMPSMLSEAASD